MKIIVRHARKATTTQVEWWRELARLYRWKIGLTLLAIAILLVGIYVKGVGQARINAHELDCERSDRTEDLRVALHSIVELRPLFVKLGLDDQALQFADQYEAQKVFEIDQLIKPIVVNNCPANIGLG